MSAFGSENMFEHPYEMNNNDMSYSFAADQFLGSKNMAAPMYPPASTSPSLTYPESLQPSMSTMSHASVASATSTASSAIGSPFLAMHHETEPPFDDWSKDRWNLGAEPDIVAQEDGYLANSGGDDFDPLAISNSDGQMSFVQPGLVNNFPYFPSHSSAFDSPLPDFNGHSSGAFQIASPVPTTGSSTGMSSGPPAYSIHTASQAGPSRRQSVGSSRSGSAYSKGSPLPTPGLDEDGEIRGRCPYPGCGRVFKDLRAHKLTHQSERPEKCPIEKCQYHVKGFARKYDQTRHTLTHYKGTMVCGFCPGSGSATEKSFNRADVFKRHLTSVHQVEQQPSNSRRKGPVSSKKGAIKDENKEGKCSTCGGVFSSAQEFYNHLDECVMKVLEKPEQSEAYNERHLTEINQDHAVKAALERNNLPTEIDETMQASDDEDDEMDHDEDEGTESKGQGASHRVSKSGRGMTRSKGGVPTISKGRRKRKDYPHSWGCGKEQMKMQKRVLCVFDGQRRLWKDEMMMDHDYEVRVADLGNNKYITDLDVVTLKKAEALHNATEDEKGPWLDDEEVTKLML